MKLLTRSFEVLVLGMILALVVGAVLGQPVLFGYVETDSMQPTLDPGDGFVAVPSALAGEVHEGDVIVFRAEEIHGGGLVTHRVVGVTEEGYITKGDANPVADQDGKEPPVKEAQIVAEALQIGGEVVVIPHLGTLVTGIRGMLSTLQRRLAVLFGTSSLFGAQGLAYLFFAAMVLFYVIDVLRERGQRQRNRERTRDTGTDTRLVMAAFAGLLVLGATAAMVVPAGTHQYGIVSAEFDSPGTQVIPMGKSENATYTVSNSGFVPVYVFFEPASEGIAVRPHETVVESHDHVNATVTLSAPPQTGSYRRFLRTHRYLAVLPAPTIRALYHVHPWAPIVVIDALIGGGFYVLGTLLVGTGRIRSRKRPDKRSLTTRLRRWFV